jgi:hypothetical protein
MSFYIFIQQEEESEQFVFQMKIIMVKFNKVENIIIHNPHSTNILKPPTHFNMEAIISTMMNIFNATKLDRWV